MKPLAIDLFCGLGGWTEGLLAEGWRVIGFDIERRAYPATLVLQDVLTIDGAQFRDAQLIVASPPCQAYSYRSMPWKRAKDLPPPDNTLFDSCFRIQREASAAAGGVLRSSSASLTDAPKSSAARLARPCGSSVVLSIVCASDIMDRSASRSCVFGIPPD